MKAQSFKIQPDGSIIMLYDENSPIIEQGDLSVSRASNVLFDDDLKMWFVEVNSENGPVRLEKNFKKRSEAINYEIEFLNGLLGDGGSVKHHFDN